MTLDEAIKHAEEVADTCEYEASKYDMSDSYESYVACQEGECADEHRQLAEWLKQLKEIKRILDAPSYEENGVTYSYCYDSDTKLKHIREVVKND